MAISAAMAQLRTLLSLPPSVEVWNQIVHHIDEWAEPASRGMALDYTRQHLKASWPSRWLVPNGSWPGSSVGWSLAKGERMQLESLEQASMVWCPSGEFVMGTTTDDPDSSHWESPPTPVQLTTPFWLQTTPVTSQQWEQVMGNNPSHFQKAVYPVEMVSWFDTLAFCNALSRLEGLEEAYELYEEQGSPGTPGYACKARWKGLDVAGYRLPTSAEWEYACRAGTTGTRYAQNLSEIAWTSENSGGRLHTVGTRAPNPWHLFDMFGQVWEWCQDGAPLSGISSYPGEKLVDPVDTETTEARILRGGAWYVSAWYARASYYAYIEPQRRVHNFGFRLARSDL